MQEHAVGLRERKHAETRSHLEEAAVSLAIKDGLEKTTIDAISEMANVSPRTFFNYFDSKEDAILGVSLADKNEQDKGVLQFQPQDDIVYSVVDLIIGFINPSKNSLQLQKKRIRLIRQYPTLLERQISRITKINDALTAQVKAMILVKHPDFSNEQAISTSEVIVMTCVGGVRIAMKEQLLVDAVILTGDVKQRALKIIKDTMKVL